MPQEVVKQIDNFTVYAQLYQSSWIERGVMITGYLEEGEGENQGYQFWFYRSRASGPGKLGVRQEEIASELIDNLRKSMIEEMKAAGWHITGKREGRDVWQPQNPLPRAAAKVQPVLPISQRERQVPLTFAEDTRKTAQAIIAIARSKTDAEYWVIDLLKEYAERARTAPPEKPHRKEGKK